MYSTNTQFSEGEESELAELRRSKDIILILIKHLKILFTFN